jgi:hypothetical protein
MLSSWPATRLSAYWTYCRALLPNRHTDSCRRTRPRSSTPPLRQDLILSQSQLASLTSLLFGHIAEAMYLNT